MILLLFLFLFIRIKEILGEIGLLQYVPEDKIQNFLKNNQMSIIFYSNPDNKSREELLFTNDAITIYKEIISFAISDRKNAPSTICSQSPQEDPICIVPYEGCNPIQFETAPRTAPAFLNWIDLLSHPKISAIFSINKLNKLLNGNESCIFAVDVQEDYFDNVNLPKEKKIYMVSSDLFSIYNLTIDQGIYFYRPNDRQILKLTDNYDSLSSDENMKIQFYESLETGQNLQERLICGFAINENDPLLCEEQYKILSDLSKNKKFNKFLSPNNILDDFNEHFVFTVVKGENIEAFANMTCMRSVPIPYFFVVNVSNPSRLRWVVDEYDEKAIINTNNQTYNYSYFVELLNRIYLNEEDPYIVSEFESDQVSQSEEIKNEQIEEENDQISTQNTILKNKKKRRYDNKDEKEDEEQIIDDSIKQYSHVSIQKIVGRTFSNLVFDDYYEALVLFTSPNSTKYKYFKPIVNAVAFLLNKTGIRFYYMDVSKNDVPASVPPLKKFPTLMLWPAGHKDEPIVYQGNNTFIDVLSFVQKYASHKVKVPHFDLDSIKEKLAAILNKIRFGN